MAKIDLADDEFTAEMIHNKMPEIPGSTLGNRLNRQVKRGVMTKRILLINGRNCNVYRYKSQ